MIGKTLIHYEITAEIGRGGMGEVYQAKDTKLGRDVAIKVLPEEFALDTDRVARFQREAKLLASLNHPNIAAIYGLEESDGIHFLVMELIEGDTLRDRIKSGPIPVEEALKLALQMAEALEAAHEKGIIHRDLKPANIKVTPDGKVKILDFGLAKAYAGDQGNINLADSPTISVAATQQGVILGTAAYMSPEQAKGKSVDKRADIWAFGVVFFEMLTGRQLFTGETASETLASVMKSEPEWNSLPANLHSRIRLMLERCLEKDPKKRYSGINDAWVDIDKALTDPGGVFLQPIMAAEPKAKSRQMFLWAPITVILIILSGIVAWNLRKPEPYRVIRLDHVLPEDQRLNIEPLWPGHTLAVSTDGSQFVYSTFDGLYLRSVNNLEARLIAGTDKDNPQSPFFSPDGKWVGYWSQRDNQLKKIPIGGGAPIKICDSTWTYGAVWNTDNTIIYSEVYGGGIKRVSADGGTPVLLVKGINSCPQLLPDGETILYADNSVPEPWRIMVHSLKTEKQKELFSGGNPKYLPTGHIIYWLQNNLYAVPFDPDALEVTGGSVSIGGTMRFFTISDSGTLLYIPEAETPSQPGNALVWVDRDGNEEPLGAPIDNYFYPKISPDGTRIAFCLLGENDDLWVWDVAHRNKTRLTFHESSDMTPLWTPEGDRIVFSSPREGPNGIYWKKADGTGQVERLLFSPELTFWPYSWSSDGKTLVMSEMKNLSDLDISILSMEGDRTRKPLLEEDFIVGMPQVSPDGRWMAYCSTETGQNEIFVRPFPDVGEGRWTISTSGGTAPLWSPDGKELFYIDSENSAMVAVEVETEPTFKHGAPKTLFQGTYIGWPGVQYDIHPDGKRFLLIKLMAATDDAPVQQSAGPRKINIVLNWFEELKQRVPVD